MAYTTLTDFLVGQLVTAAQMNAILNNIEALKDPPTDNYEADEGSDYTTSSTTFVEVDGGGSELTLEIETTGGDVQVVFNGSVKHSGTGIIYFNVYVDGVLDAANDGYGTVQGSSSDVHFICINRLIRGLDAGTHTFALAWKTNTGTATMYAGAGTATYDSHPQFWVKEV